MNTIQVAIKFESSTYDSDPQLTAEVLLDGKSVTSWTEIPVDILQLVASAEKSGAHFIWNCSCGFPECTGIETGVKVQHTSTAISWHVTDPPFEHPAYFEFERMAYCVEINRAWKEYVMTYKSYRAAGVAFDLCPWVPEDALLAEMRNKKQ